MSGEPGAAGPALAPAGPAASKTIVYPVDVQFGDCDPAGIVFYPNFLRWMDAASHHYFVACGLPPWRAVPQLPNCVGAPLLEVSTRFHQSATYGERIEVHSTVTEWRGKVFVQRHAIRRGAALLCEGSETRILCVREGERLRSIAVPAFVIAACRQEP